MRLLYLDCSAGIAGDMLLAALLDLGAPLEYVLEGLRALDLSEPWEAELCETSRRGVQAKRLVVRVAGRPADVASHEHSPSEIPARPYQEIRRLLERAPLPEPVRERAQRVFWELARAEAAVHGIHPDAVHFHEIGSTDAIIDVVGCCLAVEALRVDAVEASPLHLGSGFVSAAHGRLPVPAPATLRLVEGIQVYQTDIRGELVTPTGAALVRALCRRVGPMPLMEVIRTGWGAGAKDFPIPNVLRAVLGETAEPQGGAGFLEDEVVEIETNLDDMSPELVGALIERLFAAGALDAWVTPATMKKARPGSVLHVLASPHLVGAMAEVILRESTALGLRYHRFARLMLQREWITVSTAAGPVRVKIGRRGGEIWNIAPEYEDCLQAAKSGGLPLKRVMLEACKQALIQLEAGHAP